MAATIICSDFGVPWTSLVAQTVKCLSTVWETRAPSLVWEDLLEKERAIHSSTIAWKIPWTEEPGRLQSTGSQRVGQDWATSLFHFYCMYVFGSWVRKIPWRRKWQSTPVLLLGKSHGQRSLVGYSLWGGKESDMTERLHTHFTHTQCLVREGDKWVLNGGIKREWINI